VTHQPGATTLPKLAGRLSKAWYGKGYQRGISTICTTGKPLGNGPYVRNIFPVRRFVSMPIAIFTADAANAALYLSRDQSVDQLPAVPDRETDYDAFTSRPDDIEQLMLGFANINLYGSSDYSQVEFNVHRPALQDKRVRQALIYGLDRQKLIDVVYQGTAKSPSSRSRRSPGPLTQKASTLTITIRRRRKSCWMRPAGNWRRRYPRQRGPVELTCW
jgi:peptide/nickel transport system substrate-binding protein